MPQYSNFILLGDFNINFGNHSCHPLFSKLEFLSHSFALQQMVIEPTHVHHNGSVSLIDLVFVSSPVLTNSCHVIPPLSNSDHNGILVQCSWRPTARHSCANHSKGRTVWCYNHADWVRASTLIELFDWNSILSEEVDESWSNWSKQFLSIMVECIPKRTLPKRKNLPWLTKKLINSIKKRNRLYKQGKLSGNLSKYRLKRNKVTSELLLARRNFFQKLNPRRPKKFWRAMKYLTKCQSNIPTLTDKDGIEASSGSQKADLLNSFFSKCFNHKSAPLGIEDNSFPLDHHSTELYCYEDQVYEMLCGLDTLKIERTRRYLIKNVKVNIFEYCTLYRPTIQLVHLRGQGTQCLEALFHRTHSQIVQVS